MNDLISRRAAIDRIEEHIRFGDELYPLTETDRILNHAFEIAASCVYNLPSAERKKGRWIDGQDMPEYPRIPYRIGEKYCSECRNEAMRDGYDEQQLTEFCPNCGAEMRGEEDG